MPGLAITIGPKFQTMMNMPATTEPTASDGEDESTSFRTGQTMSNNSYTKAKLQRKTTPATIPQVKKLNGEIATDYFVLKRR